MLLVQASPDVVMVRRMSDRKRRMTASEGLRTFVEFAQDIFGVGVGDYELRNHAGNGFCWGSATLAGFSSGFMSSYKTTVSPGVGSGPAASTGDRVVEAATRDKVWSLIPKPDIDPQEGVRAGSRLRIAAEHSLASMVRIEQSSATPSLHALLKVGAHRLPGRLTRIPARALRMPHLVFTLACTATCLERHHPRRRDSRLDLTDSRLDRLQP